MDLSNETRPTLEQNVKPFSGVTDPEPISLKIIHIQHLRSLPISPQTHNDALYTGVCYVSELPTLPIGTLK